MKAVSYTAQWTAAIRARESTLAEGRLFNDQLAEELAQPDGFRLLEKYKGGGVQEFVIIRTRYFDDAIQAALDHDQFRQIVFIAAGMDTRAFRLNWPDGAVLYEIDHEGLLEEKQKRLSKLGASPNVKRIEVAADFSQPWINSLINAGFLRDQKTLWVAEGLLFFLEQKEVIDLLEVTGGASAPHSRLLTDMNNNILLQSPMSRFFMETLKRDGTPWRFGTNDPSAFLSNHHWHVIELKEPGQTKAGLTRWPYETHHSAMTNVPRSWLIQAQIDHDRAAFNNEGEGTCV